jgi:uncharacterized protein YjaZ
MRNFIFIVVVLSMLSCSSKSTKSSIPGPTYKVVNLGPDFERFLIKAQEKPFEEQLKFWNEYIEAPHQDFYDVMVWQKSENPQWEERKNRRLKEFFAKYPMLYPKMMIEFMRFDANLAAQIYKFQKAFHDAKFDMTVYAAPTTTFNGKAGEGGEDTHKLGKSILAFGIDMMVDRQTDPDILYSHELFHVYHSEVAGFKIQDSPPDQRLTFPLWLEGLATYVSQQMNPNASAGQVFMDENLAKVSEADLHKLAKRFLKEANEKSFDEAKPEINLKWFSAQYKDQPKDIPTRAGYLLGFKVAQILAQKHTLQEMVHWKADEIHKQTIAILKLLAQ